MSFHLLSFHPLQVTICPRFASAPGTNTAATSSAAPRTRFALNIIPPFFSVFLLALGGCKQDSTIGRRPLCGGVQMRRCIVPATVASIPVHCLILRDACSACLRTVLGVNRDLLRAGVRRAPDGFSDRNVPMQMLLAFCMPRHVSAFLPASLAPRLAAQRFVSGCRRLCVSRSS